jgi:hypothetical protein
MAYTFHGCTPLHPPVILPDALAKVHRKGRCGGNVVQFSINRKAIRFTPGGLLCFPNRSTLGGPQLQAQLTADPIQRSASEIPLPVDEPGDHRGREPG